jgi:hypothetical protein
MEDIMENTVVARLNLARKAMLVVFSRRGAGVAPVAWRVQYV